MKKLTPIILTFTLALVTTSCLKTRAQLREDGDDKSDQIQQGKAVPVSQPPQDVQPQGQYVIDEIKGEMTRLNGRIEDLERAQKDQSANANATSKEDYKKLEQRITELEKAQADMIEAIKKLQAAPAPAATAADSASLFDKAKEEFDAGNFQQAADDLATYLKGPKPKHAEDATFLRGEAHYRLKEYKKAIADYSRFPEKFTKSTKMPAALLKIGQCFDALGMKDDAKGFYEELVDKFPKSSEAKKAKAKLK